MTPVYWLEQTLAGIPPADDWLTAPELERLHTMRFPKRRDDWRLGRWTAKRAVAAYLGTAMPVIEIRSAPSGAPEVWIADAPAPLTISLSHRAGVALCALAEPDTGLGCDLEVVEERSSGFLTDYFTAEEQALVAEAPPAERPRLVTLLWSAKESVLKALRVGLRFDTRSVVVEPILHSRGSWHPLRARFDDRPFCGWWRAADGLVRTFAISPYPRRGPPDASAKSPLSELMLSGSLR